MHLAKVNRDYAIFVYFKNETSSEAIEIQQTETMKHFVKYLEI